jgi:uncharacterized phage protein (TIGR01671 family)
MTETNHKFRVWDITLKKWGNPQDFIGIKGDGTLFLGDASGCSVMQKFVEMMDVNKKEIFEGDIVKWQFAMGIGIDLKPAIQEGIGEVKIDYFTYGVRTTNKHGMTWFSLEFLMPQSDAISHKKVEVIGNIFETPELLK